jgi:hypothetical protein
MPAEELSKQKWIKQSSKLSTTVLKELIVRYDRWISGGGVRTSIAGPLDWEEEEEEQYVHLIAHLCLADSKYRALHIHDEDFHDWEFGTVRSRASMSAPIGEEESLGLPSDDTSALHTLRPSGGGRLPSSMRHLFGDDTKFTEAPLSVSNFLTAATASPFNFNSNSRSGPSMDGMDPPSNTPTARPARNHGKNGKSTLAPDEDQPPSASEGSKAPLPLLGAGIPRGGAGSLPPLSPGIPQSAKAGPAVSQSRQNNVPPLGPGIPRIAKPGLPALGPGIPRGSKPAFDTPLPKEVVPSKPVSSFSAASEDSPATITIPNFDTLSERPMALPPPAPVRTLGRARSKSSASANQRKLTIDASHYPTSSADLDVRNTAVAVPSSEEERDDRGYPRNALASSGVTKFGSLHQTTHSYDSILPDTLHRRLPSPAPSTASPLGRSRSAAPDSGLRIDLPDLKDVLKVSSEELTNPTTS